MTLTGAIIGRVGSKAVNKKQIPIEQGEGIRGAEKKRVNLYW